MRYNSEKYRKFQGERIAAGKLIDPKTADFMWKWAEILNPYGVLSDLSEEERCVGRVHFLRSPAGDIWVNSYDLPEATRHETWRLLKMGFYKDDDD
jgi:hypothetical protein